MRKTNYKGDTEVGGGRGEGEKGGKGTKIGNAQPGKQVYIH